MKKITRSSQVITLNVSVKQNLKWKEKFKMFFLGYFRTEIWLNVEVFANGDNQIINSEVCLSFHPQNGETHYPQDNTNF